LTHTVDYLLLDVTYNDIDSRQCSVHIKKIVGKNKQYLT